MRLSDLGGRRVAVLGLGVDVLAALDHIRGAGPSEICLVHDGPSGGLPADLELVSLAEAADRAEVFVRAPGFPRYQAPLLDALDRGGAMTTPVDLWMGTFGPGRTVVGVTGTKGKSTVTELIGVLAGRHDLRVGLAGNLGPAALGDGWDSEAPIVVLEVSSYQAADLHHVPDIAVLTYLSQDHLSWHGGVERYVSDKLRLFRNESGRVDRVLTPALGGGEALPMLADLGLEAELVPMPDAGSSLPGHRVQNAALAARVVSILMGSDIGDSEVIEAAGSSLPGRLDTFEGPGGILCVDDALASNPSAAAACLGWVRGFDRPTVVMLGGVPRGVDPAPLAAEAARWAPGRLRAVALPPNGVALAGVCGIDTVGEAAHVADAVRLALRVSAPDGVIALSPGAPTPPGSGNWETRSGEFRSVLAAAAPLPSDIP